MAKIGALKSELRDVSSGIQKLRECLLVRKYVFQKRLVTTPKSNAPPDVPRGPEDSHQWHAKRRVLESVKLSVKGYQCPSEVVFNCLPTSSKPLWFDGKSYYEYFASRSRRRQPPSYHEQKRRPMLKCPIPVSPQHKCPDLPKIPPPIPIDPYKTPQPHRAPT